MLTCVYSKLGEMRVVLETEAAQLVDGKLWFDHPSCKPEPESMKKLKAKIEAKEAEMEALQEKFEADKKELLDEKAKKPKRARKPKASERPKVHDE